MKRILAILLLIFCSFLASGCGKDKGDPLKDAEQAIHWGFSPEGIILHLAAAEKLNWHGNAPSSLTLCVYQLAAKLPVATMLQTRDGIEALLECSVLDSSIVIAQRLFLNPGEHMVLPLDREEGVTYVALVAGYHNGTPEGMGVFREISAPPPPKPGWFSWLWGSTSTEAARKPEQLVITLYMAASRILPRPAFLETHK